MAFARCRKCRGGTPTGERVPLDARRIRRCGCWTTRLSAFCLPFTRKDGEGEERVAGAKNEVANSEWWLLSIRHPPFATRDLANSGAHASRERNFFFTSPRRAGRGRVSIANEGEGGAAASLSFAEKSEPSGSAPSPHPLPARGEREHSG